MISVARAINQKCAGAVIAPWEIDQLDDDWIHAFMSDIPTTIVDHNRKIAEIRAQFLAKHKVN